MTIPSSLHHMTSLHQACVCALSSPSRLGASGRLLMHKTLSAPSMRRVAPRSWHGRFVGFLLRQARLTPLRSRGIWRPRINASRSQTLAANVVKTDLPSAVAPAAAAPLSPQSAQEWKYGLHCAAQNRALTRDPSSIDLALRHWMLKQLERKWLRKSTRVKSNNFPVVPWSSPPPLIELDRLRRIPHRHCRRNLEHSKLVPPKPDKGALLKRTVPHGTFKQTFQRYPVFGKQWRATACLSEKLTHATSRWGCSEKAPYLCAPRAAETLRMHLKR